MTTQTQRRHPAAPRAKKRAFTLVEILAATAVMSIVMLIVISLVSYILDGWNRGTANLEVSGRAQFAADILEKELGSLEIRQSTKNYEFFRATDPTTIANGDLHNIETSQLIFLTTPADSTDGSVQCVSYKIAYQNPLREASAHNRIYGLYRTKASAADTLLYGYVDKDENPAGLESAIGSFSGFNPTDASELLIPNALSLRIIPYYYNDSNEIVPFEGTRDNPLPVSARFTIDAKDRASMGTVLTNKKLAYIDIVLTLLTTEGVDYIKGLQMNAQSQPDDLATWLARYTTTFIRRVTVQGQSE